MLFLLSEYKRFCLSLVTIDNHMNMAIVCWFRVFITSNPNLPFTLCLQKRSWPLRQRLFYISKPGLYQTYTNQKHYYEIFLNQFTSEISVFPANFLKCSFTFENRSLIFVWIWIHVFNPISIQRKFNRFYCPCIRFWETDQLRYLCIHLRKHTFSRRVREYNFVNVQTKVGFFHSK